MDHGFDRGLFFCQKSQKSFFASSGSPGADTNKGTEKVSSKNTNLETNKGIHPDTNKFFDMVLETRTGSGANKSKNNKPETDKDANENSNKSGI